MKPQRPGARRTPGGAAAARVAGLTVGLAALLAGCRLQPVATPQPSVSVADAPRALNEAERRFLLEAAGSGLYQVEAARLAEVRARDPAVKAYASMLAQQHSLANEELRRLAQARAVTWPGGPPAARQAVLQSLGALAAEAFDARFIQKVGIEDHQADLMLHEAASRNLEDRTLRAHAERMLPMLQNHLAAARQLPGRPPAPA